MKLKTPKTLDRCTGESRSSLLISDYRSGIDNDYEAGMGEG